MQNLPYLFAAYTIVWLVLFAYLFVVASQVRSVRREVAELRARIGQPAARPVAPGEEGA
jgi:CcmD family protein